MSRVLHTFLVYIFKICMSISGGQSQAYKCPAKDGQYEDSRQCDKYWECVEGEAKPKLCPDGLVFDPLIRKRNKCDQPFNVECGDRTELQLHNRKDHAPGETDSLPMKI
ncbi:protein obstructor-E-like [Sitophilus oryzae]|uniref:Protein obstructor-E-like n=1 Tax=Sitophilus oryzae TaxID=7048 RepID=A0A6J2XV17_SITOR|nr:protein obstructor-E-like [Sitophilus oryzae]